MARFENAAIRWSSAARQRWTPVAMSAASARSRSSRRLSRAEAMAVGRSARPDETAERISYAATRAGAIMGRGEALARRQRMAGQKLAGRHRPLALRSG